MMMPTLVMDNLSILVSSLRLDGYFGAGEPSVSVAARRA
jgi:hypothetical protein